jgi:two-component system phosphate regulon response regulator OmpR
MSDLPAHLLIVDDDERIRTLLQKFLMRNGYLVTTARDSDQARRLMSGLDFDLLVLDVMMPGLDGISFTRELRTRLALPILLLTARGESQNRIEGLEAGADDYLVKPFEPKELLLRINAILRRVPVVKAPEPTPRLLGLGPFRYDPDRGELWRGDDLIRLTATEAQLMKIFAASPGVPVPRERLGAEEGGDRAVDVQITRLRRKIEDDPRQPRYLQTVRGEGYLLQPD